MRFNSCIIEIHPCYLPRHKNLLLTFDLLGYSKTIIPFFHWALQTFILLITKPQPLQIELYGQHWQGVEPLYFMIFSGQNQLAGRVRLVGHNSISRWSVNTKRSPGSCLLTLSIQIEMHSVWDMDQVSVTPYKPATEEYLLHLPCNGVYHTGGLPTICHNENDVTQARIRTGD